MQFSYEAKTREGEIQKGMVEASSKEAAIDILQRHNLIIIKLAEKGGGFLFGKSKIVFGNIKKKDLVIFFRQLAIMFGAKVSLIEALKGIAQEIPNLYFKDVITKIAQDIDSGTPMSKSFQKFPKHFTKFHTSMIKSGEVSGQLEGVFEYLADNTEREYTLTSKARGAMIYPAFILFGLVVVVIVMLVWVIPKITQVLEEGGQELPLITKVVVASSNILRDYGVIFAVIILFGGIVFFRFLRTELGSYLFNVFLLKLPVFGEIFKKLYLARFADSLSTLIAGGLPIVQALEVSSDVVGSKVYGEIIFDTSRQIKKGDSISSILKKRKEIPPLVTQMIAVGEQTGQLDKTLKRVSAFYSRDVASAMNNLVTLIEPILILTLGIFATILILAILLPIYNMAQNI